MYLERFEYFCPKCRAKGVVTDVLINPELLIVRGKCESCGAESSYKAVDLAKLQAEYAELIAPPSVPEAPAKTTWSTRKFKIRG